MTDTPWLGDTCSLVDAFRAGERSPAEELEATLAAIDASSLNAFCHVDAERARARAATADVSLPFGGVPIGVKELEPVAGWPYTEASVVFADRVADQSSTMIDRLEAAGANLVGQTTASEFGGINVSVTKLHGVTGNPWRVSQTAGGSSGGSASAVAGGLVTIATGGDGGGSIRIPAGFNGLVGFKGTAGRIPRGPKTQIAPMTVVKGCLARSVRDTARWLDVCAGYDPRDPYSLPSPGGWEAGIGSCDLAGKTAAIVVDLGTAVVLPEVAAAVTELGEWLIEAAGLARVDVTPTLPSVSTEWAMSNLVGLWGDLEGRWPDCGDDLTLEMRFGLTIFEQLFTKDLAANAEKTRTQANEAMADLVEAADFVISATNPDVAYPAALTVNTRVGDQQVDVGNNGALTIPGNITGVPSIAIPAGLHDGLPVSLQITTRHHADALLLDLARVVERERPWPLVAPGAPV